jgi:hypothetical protein
MRKYFVSYQCHINRKAKSISSTILDFDENFRLSDFDQLEEVKDQIASLEGDRVGVDAKLVEVEIINWKLMEEAF